MTALEENEEFVENLLFQKENTICDLSDILQQQYPGQRGFSERSIKRFCKEKGIRQRGMISKEQLDNVVKVAVQRYSPFYSVSLYCTML